MPSSRRPAGRGHPCSVDKTRIRKRLWFHYALAAALVVSLGALAARPLVAHVVRTRIEGEAARCGLAARMDEVRVGLWPPLRLTGVVLEIAGSWRLSADTVETWWPGRTRLVVSHAVLHGPGGLT